MACIYFIGAKDGPVKIGFTSHHNASERLPFNLTKRTFTLFRRLCSCPSASTL